MTLPKLASRDEFFHISFLSYLLGENYDIELSTTEYMPDNSRLVMCLLRNGNTCLAAFNHWTKQWVYREDIYAENEVTHWKDFRWHQQQSRVQEAEFKNPNVKKEPEKKKVASPLKAKT